MQMASNDTVIVNCQKTYFGRALGVSSFLIRLSEALSRDVKLVFAVPDRDAFESSDAFSVIKSFARDIVSFDDARRLGKLNAAAIELLPHHLQVPLFCSKSIMICHDLHVFDVGWKYKNVANLQEEFRSNLLKASIVVAHFPRTYYAVERTSKTTIKHLFLTESPLLLDTRRPDNALPEQRDHATDVRELLYPAQMQLHKNHEMLIRAVQTLKQTGANVRILCSGTDYKGRTKQLQELACQCGLTSEIEFIGHISDEALRKLYWRCDGVIVPSLAEGGAYVPLEAIAAGKPVAVNQIESARLHLNAVGGDVIWFDATSVEDTARAIQQLANADEKAWFDRNALARVRISEMTWNKVAGRLKVLIDWLSGRRSRPVMGVDKDGWNISYT